jgi:hypothetical protein
MIPPYTQYVPHPTPTPKPVRYCNNCHIPLSIERDGCLCDCCWTMLEAVATPWFVQCHREMVQGIRNRERNHDDH